MRSILPSLMLSPGTPKPFFTEPRLSAPDNIYFFYVRLKKRVFFHDDGNGFRDNTSTVKWVTAVALRASRWYDSIRWSPPPPQKKARQTFCVRSHVQVLAVCAGFWQRWLMGLAHLYACQDKPSRRPTSASVSQELAGNFVRSVVLLRVRYGVCKVLYRSSVNCLLRPR